MGHVARHVYIDAAVVVGAIVTVDYGVDMMAAVEPFLIPKIVLVPDYMPKVVSLVPKFLIWYQI
jgi:hypothetical protein